MRLALLALLSLALAAPAARAFPTAAQIKVAFDAIDTSKNGAISAEEWDAASFALFHVADKNNNNFIDAAELKDSGIAEDTFRIADIDRSGYLDRVEYELMIVMEQVGWRDRNGNGRIELSELADSLRIAFVQLDTDHDGYLTPEEAAYLSPAAFKKFDTDVDGKLTPEEFIAGYRAALTEL